MSKFSVGLMTKLSAPKPVDDTEGETLFIRNADLFQTPCSIDLFSMLQAQVTLRNIVVSS